LVGILDAVSVGDGSCVSSIGTDKLVYPYLPIYDPVIDEIIVKRNQQHLTAADSAKIGEAIDASCRDDGTER
jgi:hypothetical protein